MDWDKLRVFYAVAEAGSFTHAGESLNLSQSAVSRQISALEDSVKTPLFHRHARGLILTEQGEILFMTAKDVFQKLAMAEAMLAESKDRAQGGLTITTTVGFGTVWLAPHLKEFHERYPKVKLRLVLDDAELDLGMRQADVAIRMSLPRQPDLIQRPLLSIASRVWASRDYLNRRGEPKKLQDLDRHSLIVYGKAPHSSIAHINWLTDIGIAPGHHREAAIEINNIVGIYRAVRAGVGIAALPDYVTRNDPELVNILPELRGPIIQAYFVYPEELRHSKRIAVLRDFLLEKVGTTNATDLQLEDMQHAQAREKSRGKAASGQY
ncbi:MAG: LysR family transcriptional regulator [Alphaproteobacteria bacterium]